jgi:hypothetical protein
MGQPLAAGSRWPMPLGSASAAVAHQIGGGTCRAGCRLRMPRQQAIADHAPARDQAVADADASAVVAHAARSARRGGCPTRHGVADAALSNGVRHAPTSGRAVAHAMRFAPLAALRAGGPCRGWGVWRSGSDGSVRGSCRRSSPAANCTLKPTCRNRAVFVSIVACSCRRTWAITVPTQRQSAYRYRSVLVVLVAFFLWLVAQQRSILVICHFLSRPIRARGAIVSLVPHATLPRS